MSELKQDELGAMWEMHLREVFNVVKELDELRQHRDRLLVVNNEEVWLRRAVENERDRLIEERDATRVYREKLLAERDAEIERRVGAEARLTNLQRILTPRHTLMLAEDGGFYFWRFDIAGEWSCGYSDLEKAVDAAIGAEGK